MSLGAECVRLWALRFLRELGIAQMVPNLCKVRRICAIMEQKDSPRLLKSA